MPGAESARPGPVFVVVPAYNAGATLESVFARIPPPARECVARYLVVNDGSADDTEDVLARLSHDWPALNVLTHPRNLGYGAAEKTLLRTALAEGAALVVLLHADGQYAPEKLPDMLAPLERGEAELVQGSRMLGGGARQGGMPLYKYVANRFLTAIENAAFGLHLAEYHSGYMAYARAFLEAVPFERLSDSFDFDLEMIVCARVLGRRIRDVPIPTRYAGEVSHLRPVRYGLRVLDVVRRFRRGDYHALLSVPRAGAKDS
jgi:glycosyltransferase involved in cell wall biosynthesis